MIGVIPAALAAFVVGWWLSSTRGLWIVMAGENYEGGEVKGVFRSRRRAEAFGAWCKAAPGHDWVKVRLWLPGHVIPFAVFEAAKDRPFPPALAGQVRPAGE